ncbi:MAG: response regulator [bacterium]|nr:response regulator [bacterium]
MAQRILVVDDEKALLRTIAKYFESLGYEVDCACEQEGAEALLGIVCYSLVITDLRLSEPNGNEGLKILGYVARHCPETPVVVLSAYASTQVLKEAGLLGAAALLQKPKALKELGRIVSGLLSPPM